MQLAFHNEILSQAGLNQLPLAEPAIDMLAWKVAVVIVMLKLICYWLFATKLHRNRPV
ncbi:MAG: hypothetical protein ABIQ56_02480 [Chitinophagaceae bacterium]